MRAAAREPPPRIVLSPGRIRRRCPARPGSTRPTAGSSTALPARLRQPAERLPWTLGLTQSPDGRWSDFVRLHPNRQLPLYAAQAPNGELGLTAVQLNPFLRAHHLGAFAWLVRDRIEDGQVEVDDQLLDLAEAFRAALARGDRRGQRGTACWRMRSFAARRRAGNGERARNGTCWRPVRCGRRSTRPSSGRSWPGSARRRRRCCRRPATDGA